MEIKLATLNITHDLNKKIQQVLNSAKDNT